MERKVDFSWRGRGGRREDLSAWGGGGGGGCRVEVKEGGVAASAGTGPGDGARRVRQVFGSKVLEGTWVPQGWGKNAAPREAVTRGMPRRRSAPRAQHLPREGGGDVAGSGL